MRSVFIGTVEISWHCLRTLLELGEEVAAVFSMPVDRAASISAYRSFADLCEAYGVPLYQTADVNAAGSIGVIRAARPTVIYVIGWPRLVKQEILGIPTRGCLGIHSSLLPRYRGGAPVNWGLINGETEWGVTLFYLEEGPDTGDIVGQEQFALSVEDTCKTVYDKAAEASTRLLRTCVPLLAAGTAPRTRQDQSKATLFPKRRPEDGGIDWNWSAWRIYNWSRALTHPFPGAFSFLPDGRRVLIWEIEAPRTSGAPSLGVEEDVPGTVVGILPGRGIAVQAKDGRVVVRRLQVEAGPEQAADHWAGVGLGAGFRFITPLRPLRGTVAR
jgi:methionyl-tRNA formyltransferase